MFQETQWDYTTNRDLRSINLHPSPLLISKAYKAMVESFGWKSLTILYQDNHGLLRLQELIKSPLQPNTKIVLRKFSFGEGEDNISKVLLEVKQSGAIHVVLDCDQDKIGEVLSKAQEVGIVTFFLPITQVGLVTAYHSFLVTNLDLHLVDLDRFKDSGVNITSLRLVDPMLPRMIDTVKAWEEASNVKYFYHLSKNISMLGQDTFST